MIPRSKTLSNGDYVSLWGIEISALMISRHGMTGLMSSRITESCNWGRAGRNPRSSFILQSMGI